jgi:hypothetical protein
MRFAIASFFAASFLIAAGCSNGPAPGSAEWCKNTPQEKQIDDPTAMAQCLEHTGQ